MRIFVKICGLSTPRAVSEAIHAGADAIGFVFAESPRQVTPKRAAQLCRDLSPAIIRVAVMRHPTPDEWRRVADEFAPDWLRTEPDDFARLDIPEGIQPSARLQGHADAGHGRIRSREAGAFRGG